MLTAGESFGSVGDYLLLCDFISQAKLSIVGFRSVDSQFSRVWVFGWGFFFFSVLESCLMGTSRGDIKFSVDFSATHFL